MTTSEMRESRQDRATMATAVATAGVRFEAMEGGVGGRRGGQVGGDGGGGRGHGRLHAAYVVLDTGLHLAGAGAGEEGDRLPLEVGKDAGAQPVHDVLAD